MTSFVLLCIFLLFIALLRYTVIDLEETGRNILVVQVTHSCRIVLHDYSVSSMVFSV
jgi:hypothetical protein